MLCPISSGYERTRGHVQGQHKDRRGHALRPPSKPLLHLGQAHEVAHVVRQEDDVSLGGQDHEEPLQDAQEHAGVLRSSRPPPLALTSVCLVTRSESRERALISGPGRTATARGALQISLSPAAPRWQQTCATFEERVYSHGAEREADDRGLVQGPCDGRLQRQKVAQVGEHVRLQPAPLPGRLAAQLPAEGRLNHTFSSRATASPRLRLHGASR